MKTKRKFQNYVIDFVWHVQIKVEIYELTQIVFLSWQRNISNYFVFDERRV